MPAFEVSVEEKFAAGHALRDYHGSCEEIHGHNFRVRVTVVGPQLNTIGLLVDFLELQKLVREAAAYLDHRFVNDLTPFDKLNPSAENMAKYFYERVGAGLRDRDGVVISEVRVWETDEASAAYRP